MKKRIIFSAIALATAGLVIGLAPKGVQAAQATEWSASTNWSVTNGIGGEGREALESDDGQVKLGVMDGWAVQYSKNEKVTLNGLEFTFVYTSRTSDDRAGFYFNQTKTFDYKGPVMLCAISRSWGPTQSRWLFAPNHDCDYGTGMSYQSPSSSASMGFGGLGNPQIVANYNAELEDGMHFKFEHVSKSWWKITLTEIRDSYVWECANQTTDSGTGLKSIVTYVKHSDFVLDDEDGAYLNFIGLNSGYCIIRDFQDGTYQEVAEDPATAEEIAEFKADINGALTGYPDEFVTSMADAKAAALAEIDTKTYPSEMEAIVDTFKALVKSEYLKSLGYDQEINSCVGANFVGCWGMAEYASRANDAGGIIANLESATWGMRGEFIRTYDPLNFEAKLNLSGVTNGSVFFMNFSPNSGDYISEGTRYFHLELQKQIDGAHLQVVLSTPTCSAHNVSIPEWGTTNVGTFIGQTASIGVDGNVEISFATENGETEIHINDTTATIDSTLLASGNSAHVQLGIFSGSGYSKVLINLQDAASKTYADALAAKVAAVNEYMTAHESEVAALVLTEYTDAQYTEYVAALADMQAQFNGLTSYDYEHYGYKARFEALQGGHAVYKAQVAAAIAAAKEMINGYDADDYRDAEKVTLANAKEAALAQLEPADPNDAPKTLAAVKAIADAAKETLDAIETDAQKTLAEAKVTANETLDAIDLTVYRQAEKTQAQEAIATAKTAVAAAETVAAVEAAVQTAQTTIEALKTAAQYKAEELAAAKTTATAAINAKYEELLAANDYSETNAAQLLTLKNQALEGVQAATDVDFIDEIVESVITNMSAVEGTPKAQPQPEPEQPDQGGEQGGQQEQPAEEPAKKGCGSSILATSALISIVSLIGAGLIMAKRKQD